jgi:diguanylate cyclase (GGDEF)-like protein
LRVRWRAGQVALVLAAVLAVAACWRPLAPTASLRVRIAVALVLGFGMGAAALLTSLRGRGMAEQLAFYAFLVLCLDGLGQVVQPWGWPMWPLMALMVAAVAVAESPPVALGVAALAAAMAVADAAASSFRAWKEAVAASLGYGALVFGVHHALVGEKRRLGAALADLARLRHGIDQLEDGDAGASPRLTTAALTLRQVSEEGRRARQMDRAAELEEALTRLVRLARAALGAHAVVYFDVDRQREAAYLRAADGPANLGRGAVVSLSEDPFAFVLDRRAAFYATDFKRLLWSLPYYKGEVRVGSLLAVPVWTADVVYGVLVADMLEIQALTGGAHELLEAFAAMAADAILRARASLSREELGQEFKAVYVVSRDLAALTDRAPVNRLLIRSARQLVPLEAAAVVMVDEAQTRYVVEETHGWARELEGREVALTERTWAAWVLRSGEDPYLLDNVAGHRDRMPILVLDEGSDRAESLLAVPLKARNRTLGALMITGRRGAFDAAATRVLGVLANQAAAALSTIQLKDRIQDMAVRDGLTGLYNRRAFDEQLRHALGREDRQKGRLGLVLLDIDHFKKLNDTFGHPAGDAVLRHTAHVVEQHLRRADEAARFGGEEFALILPGTDEAGALRLAERVRGGVEKAQLVFEGARLSVTVSLGVAVWPSDGKDEEALLGAADRALYAAKQSGRNRVAAASSLPPASSSSAAAH